MCVWSLYCISKLFTFLCVCYVYLAKTNKDNDKIKRKASSWLNFLERNFS